MNVDFNLWKLVGAAALGASFVAMPVQADPALPASSGQLALSGNPSYCLVTHPFTTADSLAQNCYGVINDGAPTGSYSFAQPAGASFDSQYGPTFNMEAWFNRAPGHYDTTTYLVTVANLHFEYSMMAVGAPGTATVSFNGEVKLTGLGRIDGFDYESGNARWIVSRPDTNEEKFYYVWDYYFHPACLAGYCGVTFEAPLQLEANVRYEVWLDVDIRAVTGPNARFDSGRTAAVGGAYARLASQDASQYSLIFSDGVQVSAPVPEPSQWQLLLGGAALALSLRLLGIGRRSNNSASCCVT